MAYKITDACIACGVCKDECPVSCISEGDIYVIDGATCIDCDACAGVCPVDACVAEQYLGGARSKARPWGSAPNPTNF